MVPRRPGSDDGARVRFIELWEAHYTDILAFVIRRVGDRDGAADIVAETFLVAWRRRDELPDNPRPWLFGAARKVISNTHRSDRRRVALQARPAREPDSVSEPTNNAPVDIGEAFNGLADADREILALIIWEDLTPKEAADVLGIPATRFSVRLHRAKRRLRERYALLEQTPKTNPRSCSPSAREIPS